MKKLLWIPLLALIAGCSYLPDWMGSDDEKHLEGKRYSILPDRQGLEADPAIKNVSISIPAPQKNTAWYQSQPVGDDGAPVYHLALDGNLSKMETYSSGSAPDEDVRLTSAPLIVGNVLVMLDGQGQLFALAVNKPGKQLWKVDLRRLAVEERSASGRESRLLHWFASSKEDFIGGNIAFVEGRIIATTANGHIFAIDIENGKLVWHRAIGMAIQSVPSGANGIVYCVTADNQLFALSLKDGTTQWTHNGIPQQTKILGAPAPVPLIESVIVPYSSGELVALKPVNGFKLWEENLDTDLRAGALAFRFSDIMAAPVVYGGRVFASAEGHLVALDIRTGSRIWELPITLISKPWLAGEWLFGITNQQELVAIDADKGRIRWVTSLPQYADAENKKDHIRWTGPVLANNQLIAVGSKGQLKTFAVEDGTEKSTREVPEDILLPPVVAGGKLFLLNNDADLIVVE